MYKFFFLIFYLYFTQTHLVSMIYSNNFHQKQLTCDSFIQIGTEAKKLENKRLLLLSRKNFFLKDLYDDELNRKLNKEKIYNFKNAGDSSTIRTVPISPEEYNTKIKKIKEKKIKTPFFDALIMSPAYLIPLFFGTSVYNYNALKKVSTKKILFITASLYISSLLLIIKQRKNMQQKIIEFEKNYSYFDSYKSFLKKYIEENNLVIFDDCALLTNEEKQTKISTNILKTIF